MSLIHTHSQCGHGKNETSHKKQIFVYGVGNLSSNRISSWLRDEKNRILNIKNNNSNNHLNFTLICSSLSRPTLSANLVGTSCHISNLRWLNRVMRDHEVHASAINRKRIFVFFLLFSKLKPLKHNKQGPIFAVQQSPLKSRLLVSNLNYSNNAIF